MSHLRNSLPPEIQPRSYRFILLLSLALAWSYSGLGAEPKPSGDNPSSGPARTMRAERVIPEKGPLALRPVDQARYEFGGVLGQRIAANADNWLLQAPLANPGMLEMFRVRDRQPEPQLVPWAGEFVGKYLISAIQALRMTESPALKKLVSDVVADLMASQAEDGYLGPFPKAIRLQANWDLWGHYHCLQALLLWHQATGDESAFRACRRAADLICRTFLDQPRRVYDAGSHEMNMAVIHVLGELHRLTGEARYLRMMREIEKDWERAGDYFRTGLAGLEFFQTPRPRWESLHDLQGLLELYRITGDARYRTAFEHHWSSIVRFDRHNTGGFTSGEQATGNPYSPGAIETCCTVAWMALTVDMLKLTGDPTVADELELSTFNGAAGAQHPSGRWWTYNTPMDGVREASAHSIVFQSRAGTPELNCCSVNAPRSLGMLSEWAVMTAPDGMAINYYGPGRFAGRLADETPISIRWETDYPLSGQVRVLVEPDEARSFNLKLRIPSWSGRTKVFLNQAEVGNAQAGRYLELNRLWQKGDVIELAFDMGLRFVTGDREAAGKVSLYRGPLLLAYDQKHNDFDETSIPALDLNRLNEAKITIPTGQDDGLNAVLQPWLLVDLIAAGNRPLRLCDFASAGAAGTRYRSWLAAADGPPPPVVSRVPLDRASIPLGKSWFKWTGPPRTNAFVLEYRLAIADSADFARPALEIKGMTRNRVLIEEADKRRLSAGRWYYWRVTALNRQGATESVRPPSRFQIDPAQAPAADDLSEGIQPGPDGVLVRAALRGEAQPDFGRLKKASSFKPAPGPNSQLNQAVELDGKSEMLVYALGEFPEEDYSMSVWVRITSLPENHLGQVFCAWSGSMDDPLRVCIDKGKVFARLEAGQSISTPGVPVEPGRWHHLAAVKSGGRLELYVDGQSRGSTAAPQLLSDKGRDIALGGNPHYSGNEFLAAQFAGFAFYGRALSAAEVAELARRTAQ
ncbi:MAG: beta-L-arabinofuranosidase domain-containing protein [Verrucomicrobiota bacterium]